VGVVEKAKSTVKKKNGHSPGVARDPPVFKPAGLTVRILSLSLFDSVSHLEFPRIFLYYKGQMSKQHEQKERKKNTVRTAGLKTRRSFSYTKITKKSCF
jgi:hypothetical protein